MCRGCSAYSYKQQLLMALKKIKKSASQQRQQHIYFKNKSILFVLFPSNCQEPRGMHNSWGHAWHLITVLLAEQNLPATLGSSFHVVQMEIRSHIPDENQSTEMEAEIQHCTIPQRLPLGNNKPFTGPCKEENVNSTFADAANISQEANFTKYQAIASGSKPFQHAHLCLCREMT